MYNGIVNRLFKKYTSKKDDNAIMFFNEYGETIAILYPDTEVLNVFLCADENVVWNHWGYAILVIAKKWNIKHNGRFQKTEAVWLKGMCGATRTLNLKISAHLDSYCPISSTYNAIGSISATGVKNCVKINLFNYEIKYTQVYDEMHLNTSPAIVYPPLKSGKRNTDMNVKLYKYLRSEYNWNYNSGYNTAGSKEIRDFIDNTLPQKNYTELSTISIILKYSKD